MMSLIATIGQWPVSLYHYHSTYIMFTSGDQGGGQCTITSSIVTSGHLPLHLCISYLLQLIMVRETVYADVIICNQWSLTILLISCLLQVIMVEETVYDDVIECDHSYDKRCHTSYTTAFEVSISIFTSIIQVSIYISICNYKSI